MATETISGARMTPAQPRRPPPWVGELHRTLGRIRDDPAALAACRRGLGKRPLDVPAMWPYLSSVLDAVPETRAGRRAIEEACHQALALYATHQQSRPDPMHVRAAGRQRDALGRACIDLRTALERKTRSAKGVIRRFLVAATADSVRAYATLALSARSCATVGIGASGRRKSASTGGSIGTGGISCGGSAL
jgi:hypothetical protein